MTTLRTILFSALVSLFSLSTWAAPVNVNTADAATLAVSLVGVGATKAQAIVAYREENGPFASADDLVSVKGIGTKTLERNRSDILLKN